MNKILIAIALLIAGVSYGQQPEKGNAKEKVKKEVGKNMKTNKEEMKGGKPDQDKPEKGKDKDDHGKPDNKGEHHSEHQAHQEKHPEMNGKKKEHPGQGHAYGRNKGDLSGREFGMTRAGKTIDGDKIKSDDEAREVIREVKEENKLVITEVKSKLDQAVDILKKKREAGEISEEEYILKSAGLELLKKKEEDLKNRILGN